MKKYNVGVLGATGIIGQQFSRLLIDHPRFNLEKLYASERSAGKEMKKIWELPFFDCPDVLGDRTITSLSKIENDVDIVFSGLPSSIAGSIEQDLRESGIAVFSNAGAHRMDHDVPILIPEINAEHISLINLQKERVGSDGFIVTNSNCSAAGAAIYLSEVNKVAKIKMGVITTYQALSGAGINGVPSMAITGNVIPYINNEEDKIIAETKKITGELIDNEIVPNSMRLLANAARVQVVDGHLEAISCFLDEEIIPTDLHDQLRQIKSPLTIENYHIAPKTHLHVSEKVDRPQPKLDVFRSDRTSSQGMTVHTGRLRSKENDLSAYVLVHNTIRGGAGGSVLNAEFAINEGYL